MQYGVLNFAAYGVGGRCFTASGSQRRWTVPSATSQVIVLMSSAAPPCSASSMAQSTNGCVMVPQAYGLKAICSISHVHAKSRRSGSKSGCTDGGQAREKPHL